MRRVSPRSVRGSPPRMRTVPRAGAVSPQSIRSMVDLPAPFGPSRAVTPRPTRKDTSDTATRSPNHFDAPVTSMGHTASAVIIG